MNIVIDTVSVSHLLRCKTSIKEKGTCLDQHIRTKKIKILLDKNGGLIGEWIQTCSEELIYVLINNWEQYGGVEIINEISKTNQAQNKKLRQMGFKGTIDKLILRLAISVPRTSIISDDNHFWDPRDKRQKGSSSARVAKYIKNEFNVRVLLFSILLSELSSNQ